MSDGIRFPLLCGYISLDLVNTEIVRRGQRIDLFMSEGDIIHWLNVMAEESEWIGESVKQNVVQHMDQVMMPLIQLRAYLRKQYEAIADGQNVTPAMITYLERLVARAPFTYHMSNGKLTPIPIGNAEDQLIALIAFDTLKLIEQNKLSTLKRCSNLDCVLLFMDETGRRKWCSMKICGNRQKVARFQQQQNLNGGTS